MQKKPFLKGTKKPDLSDQEKKLTLFYRYRPVALYKAVNNQTPFAQWVKGKDIKVKKAKQQVPLERCWQRAVKAGSMKSKYRHRQKPNWHRCPALARMRFDYTVFQKESKSQRFQKQYEDLVDSHDQDEDQKDKFQHKSDPRLRENIQLFRRKHAMTQAQRIFIVRGGYEQLSRTLEEGGWVRNQDWQSKVFDLKFVTRRKEIDFQQLLEGQLVNHFPKNNSITTKYGLCRNLRNAIFYASQDIDLFFPKCFDLHDLTDFQDFLLQFRVTFAHSLLLQQKAPLYQLSAAAKLIKHSKLKDVKQKIRQFSCGSKPFLSEQDQLALKGQLPPLSQQKYLQKNPISLAQITDILQAYKRVDPQSQLNKENIWIVKPASMSRGRGIRTLKSQKQILEYVLGRNQQWIVQKYIQNPLLIKNKKFDLRQWVLVTQLKPLKVYKYKQFYVRFSSNDYDPSDLKNKFSHLTNNQINKHSPDFHKTEIQGSMYSQQLFTQELQGRGLSIKPLKKKINRIIKTCFQSVNQIMTQVKDCCFQIYGFDIMVDNDLNCYLIQINSSPSMENSTSITSQLVTEALRSLGQSLLTNWKVQCSCWEQL